VKNLFANRDLSDASRRRIELAVAVARERLLATHVDHALALIRLADDRMSYVQTLGIYTRMLGLDEDDAQMVTTRSLATLGEREAAEDWPEPIPEPEPDDRAGRRRTLLDVVRNRLRGRVDEGFRQQVEFAAARAEVALLEAHIENALEFLEILEKTQSPDDAVELYLAALEVRDGIAEVVYYKALSVLADRHLPEPAPERSSATEEHDPVRLRVVDRDRKR
jgi:hypothetical protein